MTDDRVALDYAPPPERKGWHWVWEMLLLLSVGHLVLVCFFVGGEAVWSRRLLLLPFHVAAEFGLLRNSGSFFILFVLTPLNSLLYGAVLTALVLIVRRLVLR